MQKNSKIILFTFLLLIGLSAFNIVWAESLDISFVDKLRYSQESFWAGEDLRIYSTLQNNSGFDLRGTIRFYDNEKFIGDFDFFVTNQKTIEAWVDWYSIVGEHNLSIKIYDIKKLEIAREPENVSLDKEISFSEKVIVDIDTDKDGVGNLKDTDDDDDGILDKKEIEQGTDPLVFNESVVESKIDKKKTEIESENSEIKNEVAETLFENVKNITDVTLVKSKALSDSTKTFLEKHKEVIDEEIEKDKKIELAQKELQEDIIEEEKEGINLYTASIIDAVPSLKEIYSFILGVLIFIFNTWWMLLGGIFLIFWFLWRKFKNRLELRRF